MILAVPVLSWYGHFAWAALAAGIVLLEGVILLANRWRCPMTGVAARYTQDQTVGFDIYLPAWLARHNKTIFTVVFALGIAFALWRWFTR